MQAYLHFAENGSTPSDIEILIGTLDSQISALGIRSTSKPDNYYSHGLDESKLEELISKKINYNFYQARINDVDSIAAVHRLRKGNRDSSFERCAALLITTNSSLARATVVFKGNDRGFPLALDVSGLASILWVRTPAALSDVPKQLLISSAYAGMQPSSNLWSRYLEEIDKLESKQSISSTEAVALRSTTFSRTLMMEETLGEAENLPSELPIKVLESLREEYSKPYKVRIAELERNSVEVANVADHSSAAWLANEQELEISKKKNIELERRNESLYLEKESIQNKVDKISQDRNDQLSRIKRRAEKLAARRFNATFILMRIVLFIIFVLCIIFVFQDPASTGALKIIGIASIVSLVLPLFPNTKRLKEKAISCIAGKIQTKLLKNSGLE